MLTIRGLGKALGGRTILERIELSCQPGEVVVVTGANGSGKSTLLHLLAGLLEPSRGDIEICGHSLRRQPAQAKACLGYVPDALDALPELLVSELVGLVAVLKGAPRGQALPVDPLWKTRLGVDATWGQRLRSLSFGQRKRVALLMATIGAPALLILDEPSNGLDPAGVDTTLALIEERRQAGGMIFLSTNDLDLDRRLDRQVDGRHVATRLRLESGTLIPLSHR
jgi:ABC-2 type transport system ATP-binding protein